MPSYLWSSESTQAPQLTYKQGDLVQKSLFEYVYRSEMNKPEQEVAVYLDTQEALGWWHRNAARQQYGLQGWRRKMIYPDFIFSVAPDGKTKKLVVLETKGQHLAGNDDTEYKQAVMKLYSEEFKLENTTYIGQLELNDKGQTVICDLILFEDYKEKQPAYFQEHRAGLTR